MSVAEERNSSEGNQVQTRKTDRMLTKILQKLHRTAPIDQNVGKDVPVEDQVIVGLAESSDNDKVWHSLNIVITTKCFQRQKLGMPYDFSAVVCYEPENKQLNFYYGNG